MVFDRRWLWVAVVTLGLLGCQTAAPPNVYHPGPIDYQQHYAQQFDPWPEVDSAPELVGARPRGFQKPYAEPRRVQNTPWSASRWNPRNWFGGF